MINSAIRGLVLSKTAITDVIGDRFYGNIIPQGKTPPMGYFRPLPSPRAHTFDGMIDLQDTSTDIFLYAATELELETLMGLFETELDKQSGTFFGVNIYTTRIINSDGQSWSDDHDAHVGRLEIQITIRR